MGKTQNRIQVRESYTLTGIMIDVSASMRACYDLQNEIKNIEKSKLNSFLSILNASFNKEILDEQMVFSIAFGESDFLENIDLLDIFTIFENYKGEETRYATKADLIDLFEKNNVDNIRKDIQKFVEHGEENEIYWIFKDNKDILDNLIKQLPGRCYKNSGFLSCSCLYN